MRITGSRGWDLRRGGVLLLALLHFCATSALAAADGVLDVERYGTPVHVESEGRDDCAPHHDHAFCQVVRATAFGTPSYAAAHTALSLAVGRVASPAALDVPVAARGLEPGSAGPRAPPLV